MSRRITFTVEGLPHGSGSHSIGKHGRIIHASKHTVRWMLAVAKRAEMAYRGDPDKGAVEAEIRFYFERPACHYGRGKNRSRLKPWAPADDCHIIKPDVDKLMRSTADAMTGIIYDDDCQIVKGTQTKHWCHTNGRAEIVVILKSAAWPRHTKGHP